MSFSSFALKFFHLFAAVHYVYAIYYDCVYVLPEEIILRQYSFGGKLVYLTVLNVILQAIYYSLAFVNDFVGSDESSVKDKGLVGKIKDYIFAALAFPLALDVAALFWSLYAYDRQTVFPEVAESFFPSWLNHILHTNVALFIVVELFVVHRRYPSRKQGLSGLIVFLFGYLAWIHVTRHYAGKWPYPIIDNLDLPSRIAFFAFAFSFPILMYFIGEALNAKIWSEPKLVKAK